MRCVIGQNTPIMTAEITSTIAIALNATSDTVPDWIQLTPSGPNVEGRDGRKWTLTNPEEVVAAFRNNGADLPVDFEHATQVKGQQGEPAPAIGWIKDMEVREGALWGQVEWTDAGRNAIAAKAYRYVSPVFTFTKKMGHVVRMLSAGLTNQPNLKMAALNSQGDKETSMDEEIRTALGLTASATVTDAVTAINAMKSEHTTALNRAQTPDPEKFVPKAELDAARNTIRDFQTAETTRTETAINSAVDAAVAAGKITPAAKDFYIASCSVEGGLEKFEAMVKDLPVIGDVSGLDGKDKPGKTSTALNSEERDAADVLGMSHADFAKAKAEQEKAQ